MCIILHTHKNFNVFRLNSAHSVRLRPVGYAGTSIASRLRRVKLRIAYCVLHVVVSASKKGTAANRPSYKDAGSAQSVP